MQTIGTLSDDDISTNIEPTTTGLLESTRNNNNYVICTCINILNALDQSHQFGFRSGEFVPVQQFLWPRIATANAASCIQHSRSALNFGFTDPEIQPSTSE